MTAAYVPVWCKSNFTFLEGASHPAELVGRAAELGLKALALTDRDGVYGIVRAHVAARKLGVKLIVGSETTLDDGTRIVLLATNLTGYQNLCRLLTVGRKRSAKGSSVVTWTEVCTHAEGLIALWGGSKSRILAPASPDALARELKAAFGDRLYALLTRHLQAEEVETEAVLLRRAERYGLPVVAGVEVLYHEPGRRVVQDAVTCIREGVTLTGAGTRLRANAEHALLGPEDFAARFVDRPEAVARTEEIASRCEFSLAELRYRYPSEALSQGESAGERLHRLTWEGAAWRWADGGDDRIRAQIVKELHLIDKLDYAGYFLTMHDLVVYCREHGILCQGRGSAANSVVCFCLGVTSIDPACTELLFERFISEERAEPPDIDLDIEHQRREEVIQHVYDYYGRDRAAMVAVVITYRTRSATRDLGKALGLPETEVGRLSQLIGHGGGIDAKLLQLAGLDADMPAYRLLTILVGVLQGFPRHLSIHPGGFLLGHERVDGIVPIENGTMANRTVIQWEKDDVEALGLFKVDLLGLGALTHLRRCFALLEAHRGVKLTMATVPADDIKTYDMLCQADTVGVFQVESRAQMSMLPRLKPRNYYDIVVQISLVRPGPISGGMVHPYLRRRAGEPYEFPHPCLEPILARTFGVPLFQEQVMRLAVVAADYTPGEADQLRRDMGAWKKHGKLLQHKERIEQNMMKKGIEKEFAERVFKQIQGFGEYGFPEAHAASFALITYVGSYLRAHYMPEFTCALLNSLPMGFYEAGTIVADAQRHGVSIQPLDVSGSDWDCTMEPGHAIRMGLRLVKGLRESEGLALRNAAPYTSVNDVVRRSGLGEEGLAALAEAGAFDRFETNRRDVLWQVRGEARDGPLPLLLTSREPEGVYLPPLTLFECINWDYDRAGHSTRGHPMAMLRDELTMRGLPDARSLNALDDGARIRYVGTVICRQRPATATGVVFMTLEDETGFVNLVIWSQVFDRYTLVARTVGCLGVTGYIQKQHGVIHLIAKRLWRPDFAGGLAQVGSRNFH